MGANGGKQTVTYVQALRKAQAPEKLARAAGISRVLEKPVDPHNMLRPLAELLRLTPRGEGATNAARAIELPWPSSS